MTLRPPSGRQFEIRNAGQRLTAVEVGGGIREYAVADRPVLDGYPVDAICDGARGQLLVPWPNRLAGASYVFDGARQELPVTEPSTGAAIHGLLRWANWTCASQEEDTLTLRAALYAQPGWPFILDCEVTYRLAADGLTVRFTATNGGASRCPFGVGAHPYLTVGTETIDPAVLTVPADGYFAVDENKIPIALEPVGDTRYDFRAPREIGGTEIDIAYARLGRDPDGRARVTLAAPGGPSVALWLGPGYDYVEIFTGDSLPDPGRRRRGLGVEPMTCAPNAFRSGNGLRVLDPGESVTVEWGIEPGGPGGG
jgi:aldose 1-epimerase